MWCAKVCRTSRPSVVRPVSNVSPSRLIIGVASPVGEPVVPGDDGAGVVPFGAEARLVAGAHVRADDELVGGQDQLGAQPLPQPRVGLREQAQAALVVEALGLAGVEGMDGVPALGRGGEDRLLARRRAAARTCRARAARRGPRNRAPARPDSAGPCRAAAARRGRDRARCARSGAAEAEPPSARAIRTPFCPAAIV